MWIKDLNLDDSWLPDNKAEDLNAPDKGMFSRAGACKCLLNFPILETHVLDKHSRATDLQNICGIQLKICRAKIVRLLCRYIFAISNVIIDNVTM